MSSAATFPSTETPGVDLVRDLALRTFRSAVDAVGPERLVSDALSCSGGILRAGGEDIPIPHGVKMAAFGKASLRMAHAAECGLGAAFKGGVVVAQPSPEAEEYGSGPDKRLASEVHTGAAGNLPDAAAEAGARRVLLLAQEAGEGEVLLVLISGGGSALLPLPAPPVTLLEKLAATKALVQAGASISQLNTVRKHLSAVKGGRLAAAAYPARVVALILSDVIGDPLDVIASGPTVPDTTTFGDALSVVDRLGARDKLPPTVLAHLLAGAAGEGGVSETPKVGDERLSRARSIIVGSNRIAALRATEIAGAAGFDARVHTLCLQGDTASAASLVSAMARGFLAAEPRKRVCVVLAGETTVAMPAGGGPVGTGGRCAHLALLVATHLAGVPGWVLLSGGTDGQDGPCDAAGAVVDGETVARGASAGVSAQECAARFDSYGFFERETRGSLKTGLTGTNVMDLHLLFCFPEGE